MIIWLASYPKSGNTLIRAMLSSYFFSKDGFFDFKILKNISRFPNLNLYKKLGVDINNKDELIKNSIKAQEYFNKKKAIQFVKTHSFLYNFYDKYQFTDLNNSLGAIYIVRDPRNLVKSFSDFFNIDDEKSLEWMTTLFQLSGDHRSNDKQNITETWVGSWSKHYNSWKSFKYQNRYLLIKYEDFINDRKSTFLKVLRFIHSLNKTEFVVDEIKLNKVLETTDFKYLQNLEKKFGFHEALKNRKENKVSTFFKMGEQRKWKKNLDPRIIEKIEKSFEKEMKELQYI